jgi:hypothetical protein
MDLRGPRDPLPEGPEPPLTGPPTDAVRAPAPTWPVLVLALGVLLAIGYQTFNLVREHSQLQNARTLQQGPYEQARRMRTQLEGIARRTQELAQQGNPGASAIVEQLARRGVRIQPGPPPGSGTAAPSSGTPATTPAPAPTPSR